MDRCIASEGVRFNYIAVIDFSEPCCSGLVQLRNKDKHKGEHIGVFLPLGRAHATRPVSSDRVLPTPTPSRIR